MNKEQFISALRARLDYLPPEETEKFIDFYAEAIDDRVEDGMSETEAVAAMGGIDSVVQAIEAEIPLSTIVRGRVKSSRASAGERGAWWIVLAVFTSPIWLTLLCGAFVLVVAAYVMVFALVVVLFAMLLCLGVSALALVVQGVLKLAGAAVFAALMCFGIAMVAGGLASALVSPCIWLSKQIVKLPVRFWRWMKGMFIRRRNEV